MHNKRIRLNSGIHCVISSGLILILIILGACSTEPTITPTPTLVASPTASSTPTTVPSPTATLPPTRTPRPTEVPLLIRNDITYTHGLQPDVKDSVLDICAPEQPGEWPVLILAHGLQDSKDRFVRMGKVLAREGMVVIDNSTISPTATREFAKRLKREKAADYLDAPVSGLLVLARTSKAAARLVASSYNWALRTAMAISRPIPDKSSMLLGLKHWVNPVATPMTPILSPSMVKGTPAKER